MRRLTWLALACLLVLSPEACKKKRQRQPVRISNDEMLATMVDAADPRGAVQLIKGFYGVEGGSWRWTASNFSVTLRPPLNSHQNGARLVLRFAIPDAVIGKLHSMKLSAKVNGLDLPPETFNTPGQQTYSQVVAAQALNSDVVNVDFSLDKFLPPSPTDQRELGVIVSSVGFEAK